jgi:hypothetical protein
MTRQDVWHLYTKLCDWLQQNKSLELCVNVNIQGDIVLVSQTLHNVASMTPIGQCLNSYGFYLHLETHSSVTKLLVDEKNARDITFLDHSGLLTLTIAPPMDQTNPDTDIDIDIDIDAFWHAATMSSS